MLVGLNQLVEQLRILALEASSNRSVLTLNGFGSFCSQDDGGSHVCMDASLGVKVSVDPSIFAGMRGKRLLT